jgi:16S rRNA (adenine1518-N6/adenine1519-N6)-dimethyltransferase
LSLAKLIKPLINTGRFVTLAKEFITGLMEYVRAKKGLGQHFLKDRNIALRIVACLNLKEGSQVLEIGPGTGILTGLLLEQYGIRLKVIEIDRESVRYLKEHYPGMENDIYEADFLSTDISGLFQGTFAIIGNFPYNISSQIFFKILEHHDQIPEVVGMIQKEVAERLSSGPGNKTYGILSVLLQAFYNVEYLFTVSENVFIPHPRVKSAVIRLTRNERKHLDCDESEFFKVVKTAFNQRRKVLHNALKTLSSSIPEEFSRKRAEQLSVFQFESLTRQLRSSQNPAVE